MKLVKMAGKIGAVAAAAVAVLIVWSGGSAYAETYKWGEIRIGSATFGPDTPQCLALNAGDGFYNDHTRVFQWACNGHDDQQWETQWIGWDANNNGLYQVVNKQSGKCLEFTGDASNGAQIDQITCGTWDWRDVWRIPYGINSNFHEMHPYWTTQMCLDIRGGFPYNGTRVELWTCNGGTNQQFFGNPLYAIF